MWVPVGDKEIEHYHDYEWGIPVFNDDKLYELFILQTFHASVPWIKLIRLREEYRKLYDDFDIDEVIYYDEEKIEEIRNNDKIIHHIRKIRASIINSIVFKEIQEEYGSFSRYIWSFTDNRVLYNTSQNHRTRSTLSKVVCNDLRARGMSFISTVTIYSYLQAIGVLNNHTSTCFKYVDKCSYYDD